MTEASADPQDSPPPKSLVSSAREVEAWLISLAIRALWKGAEGPRRVRFSGQAEKKAHAASKEVWKVNKDKSDSTKNLNY